MPDDEQQLKKRFEELAGRSSSRACWTYSDFLNLAEQDILSRMRLDVPYVLEGGHPTAERKIAVFGSEAVCGYAAELPICCLSIAPVSRKFADDLTHRDFLGTLMGLGLRRGILGDIVVHDNSGYLFCIESIAGYIIEQLAKVRSTSVKVTRAEILPVSAIELPEESQVVVTSERLDSIIAAVYKLSRSEGQRLFEQGKVFTNGHMTERASTEPHCGDVISVRGFGRFVYESINNETRKGRLRVRVRVF